MGSKTNSWGACRVSMSKTSSAYRFHTHAEQVEKLHDTAVVFVQLITPLVSTATKKELKVS